MRVNGSVRDGGQTIHAHIVAGIGRLRGCRTALMRATVGVLLGAAVVHVAASRAAAFCVGDCNRDGSVDSTEAAICEQQFMQGIPIDGNPCPECNCNGNEGISSDELARANSNNVMGVCDAAECPPPTPTPRPLGTPVHTSTNPPTGTPVPTSTEPASPTPPSTATSTPEASPSEAPATVTATVAPPCVGDCDRNGVVSINELLRGVNIALGNLALQACPAFDRNDNGRADVNELIAAVNNALNGCP